MLKLLREDGEFRYAVARLTSLDETFRRLDKHDKQRIVVEKEIKEVREDMNKGFERHDWKLIKLKEDMSRELRAR